MLPCLAVVCLCALGLEFSSVEFSSTAFAANSGSSSENSLKIVGIHVGFADRYKAGLWTPVEVTLACDGEPLDGEVAVIVSDSDGVPMRVATPSDKPCHVEPGHPTTVTLITRFGRVHGDLTAEFRGKDGQLTRRVFHSAPQADAEHFLPAIDSGKLVVVIGSELLSNEDIGKLQILDAAQRPVVAQLDSIEKLPTAWYGYEGVDAIIFLTSRPEIYQGFAENDARLQAIDQWVRMGGRGILSVGSQGKEVLGTASPLAQFAPGSFEKVRTLPQGQVGALENYPGGGIPIPRDAKGHISIPATKLSVIQGMVEASEADLPLIVRTARGFGQILFVAVDLDQSPLAEWPNRPQFIAKLLDIPVGRTDETRQNTAIMHYGYNDLAGQLRSALDLFDGVGIASFSLVAGLIVLYILLIGPGDYFFLNKIVRRMTWTWFTFPLVVVLTTIGVVYLTHHLRGNQIRLNQVDLVDVDAVSGEVRGTTWANLFSPTLDTFDVSLKPNAQFGDSATSDIQVLTSWLGLPGGALGGMDPRMGNVSPWTQPYHAASNLSSITGMPFQVGATKSVTSRWRTSTTAIPKTNLVDDGGLLEGNVVNSLKIPLEHCFVAFGPAVYEIGNLTPNGSFRIDTMTKRSELKTMLTGQKMVEVKTREKYRIESTPYDQSSTDLAYILRMMMFHEATGGCHYTGLANTYQEFVDMSTLLKADRAILVALGPADAQGSRHGAELLCNGETLDNAQNKHVTVYRFVLPVKKKEAKRAENAPVRSEQLATLPH
jgi:hypothetical protein